MLNIWDEPLSFQWDRGNKDKNIKHGVTNKEIEDAFLDENRAVSPDHKHSYREQRFVLLGMTSDERLLYVVFALRQGVVRVISARDINKKEVNFYEKAT